MPRFLIFALLCNLMASAALASPETEKALRTCDGSDNYRAAYDCACVAKKFDAAYAQRGTKGWETIYNGVFTDARECALPKQIRDVSRAHCAAQYDATYHFSDHGKMGAEKFCHCVGDESEKLVQTVDAQYIYQLVKPHRNALTVCGKLQDYATAPAVVAVVAAEPVAQAPQDVAVTLEDNQTFLLIVNKNFDLNRLDIQQYKLSPDYVPGKNAQYITSYDKPIVVLPEVLKRRAQGQSGALSRHEAKTLPEAALRDNAALILRGSQVKEMADAIAKNPAITSVDYYLFANDEIYHVPDMKIRF